MSVPLRRRVAALAAAAVSVAGFAVAARPAAAAPAPAPSLVPKPVSMVSGRGSFHLRPGTDIVASRGARAVATSLAAALRPATGYDLPVRGGSVRTGDVQLLLADPGTLPAAGLAEGYQLSVTRSSVTLVAPTAHGLWNGVQTIRQLLPAAIDSRHQPATTARRPTSGGSSTSPRPTS
jgi:hexosaminidase